MKVEDAEYFAFELAVASDKSAYYDDVLTLPDDVRNGGVPFNKMLFDVYRHDCDLYMLASLVKYFVSDDCEVLSETVGDLLASEDPSFSVSSLGIVSVVSSRRSCASAEASEDSGGDGFPSSVFPSVFVN